ncbi:hypothetical protein ACFL1U_01725 [Patescibacteria group bacterium]
MTIRQRKILKNLISKYVETKKPVSSQELVKTRNFKVSSATMRNELAALEKAGYITQPHTSAGRIPTEKGYRLYVQELIKKPDLNIKEQQVLKNRMKELEKRQDDIVRTTVRAMAELSDSISLGIKPGERVYRYGISKLLQQPEFADQERVKEIAEFFDDPSQYLDELTHLPANKDGDCCNVYIGEEAHFGQNYTVLVSEFKSGEGKKGYLALLGPTRMNYERNIPMLRYLSKLISGGMMGFLIVITVT